jgi:hypothetical protein
MATVSGLQGLQRCDQSIPVVRGKLQTEFVSFNRPGVHVEAFRHVIVVQPPTGLARLVSWWCEERLSGLVIA